MGRQRKSLIVLGRCAIAFFVVWFSGCSHDPSDWYPEGKASLVSWYEVIDGVTKTCMITVKIENIGTSAIRFVSVSLSVQTNARTYYKTISADLTVLPRKTVFLSGSVVYAMDTEGLLPDGVDILFQQYE